MLNNYETVIIFSPLLSEEDIKKGIAKYTKLVADSGAVIVEERTWGLRQMSYSIKGKSNGIYYILEYAATAPLVQKIEIEYKRDENILRFLTVKLDKFGIDYNDRRRRGLVGKDKKKEVKQEDSLIPAAGEKVA
ncbi:MAG: 30S ribosomal protein S6 [Chitinophagales bacterium]|nr:30S ribosomal protein S6 [Chitinophagales bacterium]